MVNDQDYLEAFKYLLHPIVDGDPDDPRLAYKDERPDVNRRFANLLFYGDENWMYLSDAALLPTLKSWFEEGGQTGWYWGEVLRCFLATDAKEGFSALGLLVSIWERQQSIEFADLKAKVNPEFDRKKDHPQLEWYKWDPGKKQYVYADKEGSETWWTWEEISNRLERQLGEESKLQGYEYDGAVLRGTRYYALNSKGVYVYSDDKDGKGEEGWKEYEYWRKKSESHAAKFTLDLGGAGKHDVDLRTLGAAARLLQKCKVEDLWHLLSGWNPGPNQGFSVKYGEIQTEITYTFNESDAGSAFRRRTETTEVVILGEKMPLALTTKSARIAFELAKKTNIQRRPAKEEDREIFKPYATGWTARRASQGAAQPPKGTVEQADVRQKQPLSAGLKQSTSAPSTLALPARSPIVAGQKPKQTPVAPAQPKIPASTPSAAKEKAERVGTAAPPGEDDVVVSLADAGGVRLRRANVPLDRFPRKVRDMRPGDSQRVNCRPFHGTVKLSTGLESRSARFKIDAEEMREINRQYWRNLRYDQSVGYYLLNDYILFEGASGTADQLLAITGVRPHGYLRKHKEPPPRGSNSPVKCAYLTNIGDRQPVLDTLARIGGRQYAVKADTARNSSRRSPGAGAVHVKIETGAGSMVIHRGGFVAIADALNFIESDTGQLDRDSLPQEFIRCLSTGGSVWLKDQAVELRKDGENGFIISLPKAFTDNQKQSLRSGSEYWVFDGKLQLVPDGAAARPEYAFLGRLLTKGTVKKGRFGKTVEVTYPSAIPDVVQMGVDRDAVVSAWTVFNENQGKKYKILFGVG